MRKEENTRTSLQVKWFLIKNAIQKKEDIKVSDADIEELAKADAEKTGIDVEKLVSYYKSSRHADKLIDEKIFNFLQEQNEIKKVDPKEFSPKEKEEVDE